MRCVCPSVFEIKMRQLFSSQEMTAYKKKMQNDGAPMMGAAQANQTIIKSDSEEEWKEDDE